MSESLTFIRTRERKYTANVQLVHRHFIITFFNVENVLLYVIYQLNFIVFMHVTRTSHYITLYIAFGIIRGFP